MSKLKLETHISFLSNRIYGYELLIDDIHCGWIYVRKGVPEFRPDHLIRKRMSLDNMTDIVNKMQDIVNSKVPEKYD